MKRELNVFLAAVMFYTRIPVPKWTKYSQEYLNDSTRYFPLMGWVIGGVAAGTFHVCQMILPVSISVLLSMIASILLTGAFHEDGFADMCDGFGGGWSKKDILTIMKDSRIGTYGTIGLIFILVSKFLLLLEMNVLYTAMIIFIAHSVSRGTVILFRYHQKYVRENDDSKAKPMAKEMSWPSLLIASITGFAPLYLFKTWSAIGLVLPSLLTGYWMTKYFQRRIGGYTGDCLGAMQQVCEVIFYLSFICYGHLSY